MLKWSDTFKAMFKIKIHHDTFLKKDSVLNASQLADKDKAFIKASDTEYEVTSYTELGNHTKVAFKTATFGSQNYNTWNIYKGHFDWVERPPLKKNTVGTNSNSNRLPNFPYHDQTDNAYNPGGACNVTSFSMVFHYFGLRPKSTWSQFEDELYLFMQNKGLSRHSPWDLQHMAHLYDVDCDFKTNRTIADIVNAIDAGKPCILHGYFTTFGHIIVVHGYTNNGLLVHDPYGEYWSSGYDRNNSYNRNKGKNLIYSDQLIERVCSPEGPGNIYCHILSR